MREIPHFMKVYIFRDILGVVDEEGAEECGEGEQAHGHRLRGSHSSSSTVISTGIDKLTNA